jgi:aspartate aminotransferase/aminotransferase
MPQSGIRRITNLAVEVPDCIRLEVGEPNFNTPPHIVEAAAKAARDGFTRYTASQGLLSLREAMSAKLERVNQLKVPPEGIVATNGALSGLFTTCLALLDPGDELLIPDPGWPNWEMMILAARGVPIRYSTSKERAFLPHPENMDFLVTPRTKAILINSPCNPTGAVMSEALVRQLVDFACRHDLWIISDECYDECLFDGEHVSPARFDDDGRVISLFSCSKTYAMTGWRVGYATVPEQAIEVVAKMQQPVLGNICSVSQKAAEAALNGPQACVGEMRDYYRARRDEAVDMLQRAGFPVRRPAGAFYIMVDVGAQDTTAFAMDLLRRKKVAVAPGETFGPNGRGLVRVALCVSPQALQDGLGHLIEVVKEQRNA